MLKVSEGLLASLANSAIALAAPWPVETLCGWATGATLAPKQPPPLKLFVYGGVGAKLVSGQAPPPPPLVTPVPLNTTTSTVPGLESRAPSLALKLKLSGPL